MVLLEVFFACSGMEDMTFGDQRNGKTRNGAYEKQYYVQMMLSSPNDRTNEFYFGDEIYVTLKTNIPPSEIGCVHYVGGFGKNYNIEGGYVDETPIFYFDEEEKYSSEETMYAIKPGHWNVQVWIYTNSDEIGSIGSNVEAIVVNFPEISEDNGWGLSLGFEEIWDKTLKAADEDGKYELGAWIYAYLDDVNLEYEIDLNNLIEGKTVGPCEGGSIPNRSIQSVLDEKIPELPWGPANSEAKFAVAYFHTHTPFTYCDKDEEKKVGISVGSDKDTGWADSYKIPIFVYDYEGEAFSGGSGYVLSGHSLDLSAKYYFYDLVTHRETPEKDYTKTLVNLS